VAIQDWQLDTLPQKVLDTQKFPLGAYRRLRFGLLLRPHFQPDVYLERNDDSPNGVSFRNPRAAWSPEYTRTHCKRLPNKPAAAMGHFSSQLAFAVVSTFVPHAKSEPNS